jgi:hypothetical protein
MNATAAARLLLWSMLLGVAGSAGAQQYYASQPIRFISPYGPAGNDTIARLLAQKLTEAVGQQVIVDNRPGGNTIIGTDMVAKSRPDGHPILFSGVNTFIINGLLAPTPYSIISDFAPVAPVANSETIMVLNAWVPANTLQQLIGLGELHYATSSAGGAGHLVGELFETSRECLAIEVGQRPTGDDDAATLNRSKAARGLPQTIKVDNGSEFISKVMDRSAYERRAALDFSRPASRLTTRRSNPLTAGFAKSV